MLHEFVDVHREEIISRCRARVVARSASTPRRLTTVDHGVPMFVSQLVDELRLGRLAGSQVVTTAQQHGQDLRRHGAAVAEAVYDYGDVCQTITEMAGQRAIPISADDFHALNRCVDDAMAAAVTAFSDRGPAGLEDADALAIAHLDALSAELRTVLHATIGAVAVHRAGAQHAGDRADIVLARSVLAVPRLMERLLVAAQLASRHPAPSLGVDEDRATLNRRPRGE
jgi:hypothetical protein